MVSSDYIVSNLTYRNDLYMCLHEGWLKYAWFTKNETNKDCQWMNVAKARSELGPEVVDQDILKSIQFSPESYHQGNLNLIWKNFEKMIATIAQITNWVPIFEDFMYQGYREFLADKVNYVEFRTILAPVCAKPLNEGCSPVTDLDLARLHKKVVEKFSDDNPSFLRCKADFLTVSRQLARSYQLCFVTAKGTYGSVAWICHWI